MNYLVIGAGMMGEAVAYDLANDPDTTNVHIVDINYSLANNLANKLKNPKVSFQQADASNLEQMTSLMKDKNVAVGVASYKFNERLTKAAIASKTHFVDAGGNNDVVQKQFALYQEARVAGVKIVPAYGIAPGAVSTLVALGIDKISETEKPSYVFIRVGGLPQNPKGALNYSIVFSVEGLINEYVEPVEVIKNGKKELVFSLDGIENVKFNHPNFSRVLEAAYTSGGTSTLSDSLEGKIETLNYKTLRYPGHWKKIITIANEGMFGDRKINIEKLNTPKKIMDEIFTDKIDQRALAKEKKLFKDLGFYSEEEIKFKNSEITLRKFSEYILDKNLPHNDKDMLLAKVIVGNEIQEVTYELVDLYNNKTRHSAMQRTTGYSIAIVAEMLAKNNIYDIGVLKIENSIPSQLFVNEWKKRNILINKTLITPSIHPDLTAI